MKFFEKYEGRFSLIVEILSSEMWEKGGKIAQCPSRKGPVIFYSHRGGRGRVADSRAARIRLRGRKSTGMPNNILVTRGWLTTSPPVAYRSVNRVTRTVQPPANSLPRQRRLKLFFAPSVANFNHLPPREIAIS